MDALRCEAHVWLCEPVSSPAAGHERWLNDEEQARYGRIRTPEGRRQYLSGQVLLRQVLSRYHPLPELAWRFSRGPHGRPEIANDIPLRLRFNLSHTAGLVGCVVALDADCGLDIEHQDRDCNPALAGRILTPCEQTAFALLGESVRNRALLEHWTLKEACLKALGLGLSGGIANCGFAFDAAREKIISAEFTPAITERAEDWQFEILRHPTGHLLALALHRGAAEKLHIVSCPTTL